MDPKAAGSDTKNPCLCLCLCPPPPPPPPWQPSPRGRNGASVSALIPALGSWELSVCKAGVFGGFICLAPCAIRALPWAEHPPLAGGQPAPSRLQAPCLPQAPS